jgi:hypothetical protein
MSRAEWQAALAELAGRTEEALQSYYSIQGRLTSRLNNAWSTLNQVISRLDAIDGQLAEYAKHWAADAPEEGQEGPEESPEEERAYTPEEHRRAYPARPPKVAITNCRCDWYKAVGGWKVDPDVGCLVHS